MNFRTVVLLLLLAGTLHAEVSVSTATGNIIEYDHQSGVVIVEGEARVYSSTANLSADKIILNNKTKIGHAIGHVKIEQSSSVITGTEAKYSWDTSHGEFMDAHGVSPPWRFSADRLMAKGQNLYFLEQADFTSCDADPPHYRIRSSKGKIVVRKRATFKNARLLLGDLPSLFTPFFSKSLRPKKYTLRIEPGQNSRDGVTVRTIFGYPLTPNSRTKLRWDYFERTGNGGGIEHQYFAPSIRGLFDGYYVRDTNRDPAPQARRYTILWNHYQKITKALTMNSKIDLKSDQVFGKQFEGAGNQIRVENTQKGLLSESGLTYQFSKATLITEFNRQDKFDSTVSSDSFISKLIVPRMTLNTIPLKFKKFPLYISLNGNWINETLERINPKKTLRYQRSGLAGIQMNRSFKASKKLYLTPRVGYSQSWQDRDLSTTTFKDLYVGRYNLGGDARQRLSRDSDLTLKYDYAVRLEKNRLGLDSVPNDHGIEVNRVLSSMESRFGRSSRLTLFSGYELRSAPKNDKKLYQSTNARIISPSADFEWELNPLTTLFFREVYSVYDFRTRQPVRTPVNTAGEIRWGGPGDLIYLSQGFSYTKPVFGERTGVNISHKLKFFLTPKWYIDAFVSYRLEGKTKLKYEKALPIEKTLSIVRDLHCWIFRMEFSKRQDRKEASFYIDLKTNLNGEKDVFERNKTTTFNGYRDPEVDPGRVFEGK
ncbi:MAG: LPS-assembly protein LptD [Elusimicrobiota bacterium]